MRDEQTDELTGGQEDRQKDRKMHRTDRGRKTVRKIDSGTESQKARWTKRKTGKQKVRYMDRNIDTQKDKQTEGQRENQTGRQKDRCTER